MEMVKVTGVLSVGGSLTDARQLPLAAGNEASIAEVPPTVWDPLGQTTLMVRYAAPDHTADTVMAPAPVKPKLVDVWTGGSR